MCLGEVHIGCWQGRPRERAHLVDEGIDGKIKNLGGGVYGLDGSCLGQGHVVAVVNVIMNLWVS